MAIVRMLHVALAVRDVARALAFYRDALGFTVVGTEAYDASRVTRVLGAENVPIDSVLLRREGHLLQLVHRYGIESPDAPPSPLIAHLALAVDDLASTLHSLRDRGVTIEEHTLVEHAPGVRSCVVRDPDGLAIVLSQVPAGAASDWDDDPFDG
jgi:catechol 2,3-dioxygenase-like lactoylglutathione lyase family enzyme